MKRLGIMCSLLVAGAAMGVRAEDRRVHFFGQLEYLTYSDEFEKNEKSFSDYVSEVSDSYGASGVVSGSNETKAGTGVRIGAMVAAPIKGLTIGGSLGYIMGPSYEGKMTSDYDNGFIAFHENEKVKDTSNLWRLMAEAKYSVPMGEKFQARLGFGVGLATLKVEDKYSYEQTGDFEDSTSLNNSITTTKMTWEIGPAIAYVTDKIGVELAVTYSQMPSAEDMNTFQQFDWNPFGIRLGVEF